MKKVIRLTESDLNRLLNKVISEQKNRYKLGQEGITLNQFIQTLGKFPTLTGSEWSINGTSSGTFLSLKYKDGTVKKIRL
jgi:hypothetical protein